MKTSFLVLLVLGTFGCSAGNTATPIVAPDGSSAVVVECGSPAACYEKISSMCPTGYAILNHGSQDGFEAHGFVNQQFGMVHAGTTHRETMVVACKSGNPVNVDDACLVNPLSRSNMELGAICDDSRWH